MPYLSFENALAVQGTTAEDVRSSLDRLTRLQALRRGLLLRCPHCLWLDWYWFRDLGETFTCARCARESFMEQETWRDPFNEPSWFYDLDQVVREALKHNGHVPLLALDRYRSAEPRGFDFTTDFEIHVNGSSRVEIDATVSSAGQLVFVEAKSAPYLHQAAREARAQAEKLVWAAEILQADAICLATSAPEWDDATRRIVGEAVGSRSLRVDWVQGLGTASNQIATATQRS